MDAFPSGMIDSVVRFLESLPDNERIEAINEIRARIHVISPMKHEPVDFVRWVKADSVHANDYNPNAVAPPEMRLLEHSISEDGYTQPIVTWSDDIGYEVIDGFHRHRVGRESITVSARIKGYLPIVVANADRIDRSDRIAATIRHNRARGKHRVDSMSDIVVELRKRNWSPKKIGIELGMDQDEVLRLCQVSGLVEMFADKDFSEAWEAEVLDEHSENISPILEMGGNEISNVEESSQS
jgi:ParB-like chromosome segregation protein Spo0J